MRNEITVNSDSYTDQQIVSGAVYQIQSFDGDELQYDTLNVVVNVTTDDASVENAFLTSEGEVLLTSENEVFDVAAASSWSLRSSGASSYYPGTYKYGAEVVYRHRGNLVGKYYMRKLTRIGKTQYKIECVSPVGMLATSQHYGGIYPNGITFSELLTDIIGGVVPFTVSVELEEQLVYGWLPVATRRDNLHQALFAMGASAQKDENGELYFAPLSDEIATEIPDNRVFLGGSISYPDTATKVSVSEHAYTSNDEDETVSYSYDTVEAADLTTPSGVAVQGSLILFEEPLHDLAVENSEILESGVNYAVLSAGTQVQLTGKKYTHTVRQVIRQSAEDAESEINVSDATLVSVANSEAVADRLMSYYSSAKTITADIVLDGEKAGSAVQLSDPFGDTTKGIIRSLDINMSGTLKARAEIVADYSPAGAGNYYNNVELVAADGDWTVPEGVSRIRVVLISGGQGGSSGGSGAEGESGGGALVSGRAYGGNGGAGGVAGSGGAGGRIFVTSFAVTEGDVFAIAIGEGGAGGVCDGTESVVGSEGTDTTFGDYSSADGKESIVGYYDLFEASTYALPGGGGMQGSDGNGYNATGDTITIDGVTYICGEKGDYSESVFWTDEASYAWAEGGYGGGATAGANGGDGEDGYAKAASSNGFVAAYGGDGGAGGDATIPGVAGVQYGSGGSGGNGGGGGGGGGGGYLYAAVTTAQMAVTGGSGGAGGSGSAGGQGAQGCVLIYY